jgi:hypothetical protein
MVLGGLPVEGRPRKSPGGFPPGLVVCDPIRI